MPDKQVLLVAVLNSQSQAIPHQLRWLLISSECFQNAAIFLPTQEGRFGLSGWRHNFLSLEALSYLAPLWLFVTIFSPVLLIDVMYLLKLGYPFAALELY